MTDYRAKIRARADDGLRQRLYRRKKCGLIFNRHKWHYETPRHRICVKCAETERLENDVFGSQWSHYPFDLWLIDIEQYREVTEKEKEERKRAIKFLIERGLMEE